MSRNTAIRGSCSQKDFALLYIFHYIRRRLVRETKHWGSPLPQDGLDIPITQYVIKTESSEKLFIQIKNFVEEQYLEPEKIPIKD